MFDPLLALRSLGAHVRFEAGHVALTFDEHVPREKRHKLYALATRFDALLRLQLDVDPGTKPRTVQQLLAAGRIRIVKGKYVRVQP